MIRPLRPNQAKNDVFVGQSNDSPIKPDNQDVETMPEENGGDEVQEPEVQSDPTPQQPATESTPAPNKGPQDNSSRTPSTDNQKNPAQNQDSEQRIQGSGDSPKSSADGEENGVTETENGDAQSFTSQDTTPNMTEDVPIEGNTVPDSSAGADTSGGDKGFATGPDQGMTTTAKTKKNGNHLTAPM